MDDEGDAVLKQETKKQNTQAKRVIDCHGTYF